MTDSGTDRQTDGQTDGRWHIARYSIMLSRAKNPGFRALYLAIDGTNSVFFRLINTKEYFCSFLADGFCLKNLAVARKIMALPESGGYSPQPLDCSPMQKSNTSSVIMVRK